MRPMANQRRKKVLIAILVMLVPGFGFLVWNEFSRVKDMKARTALLGEIVELPLYNVADPSYEGKVVHAVGKAVPSGNYYDTDFKWRFPAIKMTRNVYYYQTIETLHVTTEKDAGGRDVKIQSYTYSVDWVDHPVRAAFHDRDVKNDNFVLKELGKKSYVAEEVVVGPYRLSKDLFLPMAEHAIILPRSSVWEEPCNREIQAKFGRNVNQFHLSDKRVYLGTDPDDPQIGDVKVSFMGVESDTVSVIAKVTDGVLVPCKAQGKDVSVIKLGNHSAEELSKVFLGKRRGGTWAIRFILFILMFGGCNFLFENRKYQLLKGFSCALALTLLAIVFPWLIYKWYIGVPVLLLLVAVAWFAYRLLNPKRPKISPFDGTRPDVIDLDTKTGKSGTGTTGKTGNTGKSGGSSQSGGNSGSGGPKLPKDFNDSGEPEVFDLE